MKLSNNSFNNEILIDQSDNNKKDNDKDENKTNLTNENNIDIDITTEKEENNSMLKDSIDLEEMISSLKQTKPFQLNSPLPPSFFFKLGKNKHFFFSLFYLLLLYFYLVFYVFPLTSSIHSLRYSNMLILIFHIFFFLFTYSFLYVVISDPGSLDEEYISTYSLIKNIQNKSCYKKQRKENDYFAKLQCYNFKDRSFRENICRYCMIVKPERVHHCRQCRQCFLKKDHHCIYVNNCIALKNYKIFINMLCYGIMTLLTGIFIVNDMLRYYLKKIGLCLMVTISSISICVMLVVACLLLYYLVYHMNLVFKGITQMEDILRFDQRYDEYYDLILKNKTNWMKFTFVFGSNILFWIIPVRPSISNFKGYEYC